MNILKYLSASALFSALLICATSCQEKDGGPGDAAVGFREASLDIRENVGTIKIPIDFTGTSGSYPIVFDVDIRPEGDFTEEDAMHITQSKQLRYMGDPSVPVYLECQINDDDIVNDTKELTLVITNVKGASVAEEMSELKLSIRDNDNNPYDKLCGNWIFSGKMEGKFYRFPVKIMAGFTPDEEAENYEKTLVCWGFNGYMDDLTGNEYGIRPLHSPVWYLDYNLEEKSLTLQNNTVMAGNFRDQNTGDFVEIRPSTAVPDGKGWYEPAQDIRLKATWSEDMKTISFNEPGQESYVLACLIYTSDTAIPLFWSAHSNITLTKND